jgi:hypothetical protein
LLPDVEFETVEVLNIQTLLRNICAPPLPPNTKLKCRDALAKVFEIQTNPSPKKPNAFNIVWGGRGEAKTQQATGV